MSPALPFSSLRSFARRAPRWFLLAGLVGLLGWGAVEFTLGPRIAVVAPERGEVVRTIVASGRVLAPYRVDIGAQVTASSPRSRSPKARRWPAIRS